MENSSKWIQDWSKNGCWICHHIPDAIWGSSLLFVQDVIGTNYDSWNQGEVLDDGKGAFLYHY